MFRFQAKTPKTVNPEDVTVLLKSLPTLGGETTEEVATNSVRTGGCRFCKFHVHPLLLVSHLALADETA